jgi:DnaJ-class molecular chaperone
MPAKNEPKPTYYPPRQRGKGILPNKVAYPDSICSDCHGLGCKWQRIAGKSYYPKCKTCNGKGRLKK